MSNFLVLSIEDYPSPGPLITVSKMFTRPEADDGQRRVWAMNLHAPGAKKACLEARRGEVAYRWGDAWFDAPLREMREEEAASL